MRLLYDAVLPQSLSHEAPADVDLVRWHGADVSDTDLVRATAESRCRGMILLGRDALEQPRLREVAREAGVVLVAVATDSPIEAKNRVLRNLTALRRNLPNHDCLLVLSAEVRPDPLPSE